LWSTVRGLVAQGVSVLLTTQYLEEADQLADAVAVLDHGRIVARGEPEELKAGLGTEIVRLQFADPTSYQGALERLHPARTDEVLRTIDVATDGRADEVLAMLGRLEDAGTPAAKVSTYGPTLDDVFLSLTRDDHTLHPRSKEIVR
jgi:ABC-2 type transport system ATP-binding protein